MVMYLAVITTFLFDMKFIRTTTVIAAAIAGLLCSCQQKTYPVFFLAQEGHDDQDVSSFSSARHIVYFNGRAYSKGPVMTLNHFAKFKSELDPTDGSYGVTLYAKPEWRSHLYSQTLQKNGLIMLPVVNGLAMEPMRISPVSDGILKIWNGLNGYDLWRISRTVEPINPEIEEKRYLKKNPRPIPKMPENVQQRKDFTGRTVGEIFN